MYAITPAGGCDVRVVNDVLHTTGTVHLPESRERVIEKLAWLIKEFELSERWENFKACVHVRKDSITLHWYVSGDHESAECAMGVGSWLEWRIDQALLMAKYGLEGDTGGGDILI